MYYGMYGMQPLTNKELEYLSDSMDNEELLMKQAVFAVSHCQSQQAKQVCLDMAYRHLNHYQQMLNVVQQHAGLAQ